MSTEDDLRHALHAVLDDRPVATDGWEAIEARLGRRRQPPVLMVAAAVVAAVVVGGALVAVGARARDTRVVRAGGPGSTTTTEAPVPTGQVGFPGIWPEYSWTAYRDGATRPDRQAGAVAVAQAYLAERLSLPQASVGPYEPFDATTGQVTYRANGRGGVVLLARPGGAGAPFVVSQSSPDGLDVKPAGAGSTRGVIPDAALRDPLVLELTSAVDGPGTARAGAFGSEWSAAVDFRAVAGATQQVTLEVGQPLPEAMLVRVELTGTGPTPSVAEFRVDRPRGQGGSSVPVDEVVALSDTGIDLISLADGTVTGSVATEADLGEGASGLALSPDRRKVVWSRARTGCLSELVMRPVATMVPATVPATAPASSPPSGPSDPEVVGTGRWPAFSPDGSQLAYAVDPECSGRDRLVVRDLASGRERVLGSTATGSGAPSGSGPASVRSLSWSPDGTRLAFELVTTTPSASEGGTRQSSIRVLTLDSAAAVDGARALAPPPGLSWVAPRFLASGRLAAAESPTVAGKPSPGFALVVVDAESGAVTRRIDVGPSPLLALGTTPGPAGAGTAESVLGVSADGVIHLFDTDQRVLTGGRPPYREAAG